MRLPERDIQHADAQTLIVQLHLPESLACFDGHFDAIRIMPAVAQLYVASELARAQFGITGQFSELRQLKFRAPIQPLDAVTLKLDYDASEQSVRFCYQSTRGICSTGLLRSPA